MFLVESQPCFSGSKCHTYEKAIGLTLDDILRDEVQRNTTFNIQSSTLKISAVLTMLLFIAGLINSFLSIITFRHKQIRKTACGMYLLTSSVTSLLTVSMFVVKFWFVIFFHQDLSLSLSTIRGECLSIEFLLKFFLYFDGWLNAYVAADRAYTAYKGVSYDKRQGRHIAICLIIISPICIMLSFIHDPLHRNLIVEDTIIWCVTQYSNSIQIYDTIILFFHLTIPFVINLFSACFIIFVTAKQRAKARHKQTYKEHIFSQIREHKHLLISPLCLLILAMPRLIIALLPGCLNVSHHLWLYLSAYFISFTPSIFIFIVFVLPSDLYKEKFKESFSTCRHCFSRS